MLFIGICGLPAGGKSTVASTLQQCGAVWINADRIAHEVLEVPELKEQIVRQFGSAICRADGKIDRQRLAGIVFGDDASARAALRYLEAVVHPLTRTLMVREIAAAQRAGAPAVVLDVPLLFESRWDVWCDEVWYVDTPEAVRVAAAQRRGWSAESLSRRTARQLAADEKRRLSSRTLENHGTLEQLSAQIDRLWHDLVDIDHPPRPAAHCRDRLLSTELP